jgi:intracellular sulfur oxidation DsrE/DsrF family protein
MTARFGEDGTKADIVAIFHGAAGYMLLDDAAYDRVRNWQGGNPYKDQILALMKAGVAFEECAETMKAAGWTNADLIPGARVNTGANFRIVELVQDGFVQIQP